MKRTKEFIKRNIAGEIVLVPSGETAQEFNGMVTLTGTGEFIWEHIEQADSLEDMVQKILEEYEIDEETARKDAIAFIGQMLGAGAQSFGAGVKFIQLAGNACIVAFRRLILALLVPHRILCAAD